MNRLIVFTVDGDGCMLFEVDEPELGGLVPAARPTKAMMSQHFNSSLGNTLRPLGLVVQVVMHFRIL